MSIVQKTLSQTNKIHFDDVQKFKRAERVKGAMFENKNKIFLNF